MRKWLELIAGDIHQLNGHRIEWLSANVIQVSWRHRSGWVLIVAIVLFPLGLLALLFTVTSYGTIVLVHDGSPSTIRLGGEMSNAAETRSTCVSREQCPRPCEHGDSGIARSGGVTGGNCQRRLVHARF